MVSLYSKNVCARHRSVIAGAAFDEVNVAETDRFDCHMSLISLAGQSACSFNQPRASCRRGHTTQRTGANDEDEIESDGTAAACGTACLHMFNLGGK